MKFHGPCPKVRPSSKFLNYTEDSNNTSSRYYVVHIVPFEDKESNLFQKIPNDYLLSYKDCDRIEITIDEIQFSLYPTVAMDIIWTVQAKVMQTQSSDEIPVLSHIYGDNSEFKCHKPLNESVIMWFVDKDYLILWSCHEFQIDRKIFHDAALIYGVNDTPRDNTMFQEMVVNFRSKAKKYFNDTMDDLVKWPKQLPTNKPAKCPMTGLFECPTPSIMRGKVGFLIGIVVFIIVILLVLGIFKDNWKEKFCRGNRINPL